MDTIDDKSFMTKGNDVNRTDKLDINADNIIMSDGNYLSETIVKIRNRIYNLEKELNDLKNKL